ncbi:unnamed protein product [Didymodactylos carnosus]|uniref:Cullin family profile domain-containing protein n=1 Tax=Didymodactylos carnosus TaxID=1234261 RepID=A0A8S2HFS3_9BILA|nr:unnamed protein product [Didymodactylos carnosus]CAF3638077.1 unnamed protein product [Didymodactylos carnosus]
MKNLSYRHKHYAIKLLDLNTRDGSPTQSVSGAFTGDLNLPQLCTLLSHVPCNHDHISKLKQIVEDDMRVLINDVTQIANIFKSVRSIPHVAKELKKIVEEHIHHEGIEAIERFAVTSINDPKLYVETILAVHGKFSPTVSTEQVFMSALDQACARFINDNAVTKQAGSAYVSELLARYCDTLLKRGEKVVEEVDLENCLNRIMIIFDYIEDKDIFEKCYTKLLARRLIGELSISDTLEESMISKLKVVCGAQYTFKLEHMLSDISISKDLTKKFRNRERNINDKSDFSVMVLSANLWSLATPNSFNLPSELTPLYNSFTQFYHEQHTGRKLTWLHQYSKAELDTFYLKQNFIFQVSMYQLAVLLLFNKAEEYTVENLVDETLIKEELLLQVLCSLLKQKIITCTNLGGDNMNSNELTEKDLKNEYTLHLALDYKKYGSYAWRKINLRRKLKVEQKNNEDLNHSIDEDRRMVIQTAIVRTMKEDKTLKHQELLNKVVQQLSSRFKPNVVIIEEHIDILIEKDYLKRAADENDTYHYLA